MKGFFVRWLCTTVAVAVAVKLTGMEPPKDVGPLLAMAFILGVFNALVRPVLLVLSLPFIVLSLGLFLVVINSILFAAASSLVGLQLESAWQAIGGALVVSAVNGLLTWFFRPASATPSVVIHRSGPALSQAEPGALKRVEGRVLE